MCGIFGVVVNENSKLTLDTADKLIKELFVLSESRGKESAGIAIKRFNDNNISLLKRSVPASELINTKAYKDFFETSLQSHFDQKTQKVNEPIAIIAHTRLVTNGSQDNNDNNQPVPKNDLVGVHNGIITNVDDLWNQHPDLNRKFEVDTEVLLGLVSQCFSTTSDIKSSVKSGFSAINGTASVAILNKNRNEVTLATNNASLYFAENAENGIFIFASEDHILKTVIDKLKLKESLQISDSVWSKPFSGLTVNLADFKLEKFNLVPSPRNKETFNKNENALSGRDQELKKLLQYNISAISQLKRCTKCLLPETFPFIRYNAGGVCNYCEKYVIKCQGSKEKEFEDILSKFRSKDGKPDCIVPFSGGRDSSYGLHYIVHELKMQPITYTYDWGMVTDLSRRNIARVCGKLGIENIIVSADIKMKRDNIKKNVSAWLKNPQLGMIPLFMAGDKQFLYYVNQIKKQTGLELNIWSTNSLEITDFKTGFCGVSPVFDKTRPDYLSLTSQMTMIWYYLKNFMVNPSYINSSMVDTFTSFYSYYAAPRDHYYQLFDWVKWDEKKIEKTLFDEYNWEISPDTTSTWRIGDGTAAFYNYVYYTVAGFSEFDTFRSNQIREGLITREEGLQKVNEENKARFDSLKWYFETIGVDLEHAIKVVNNIPKLYKL